MLTKKSAGAATAQGRLARSVSGMHGRTIDRRTFLKRSGVTAGAAAFAAQLPYGAIGKAEAARRLRSRTPAYRFAAPYARTVLSAARLTRL